MRLTDRDVQTFHEQGFVIIERFLSQAECDAALEGFHRLYAPPYEKWITNGRKNDTPGQSLFPFDHSGLNHIAAHPDMIAASERLMETREIRLADAQIHIRYASDEKYGCDYHVDYGNNGLGPERERDNTNLTFVFTFSDIKEGMAPTMMVPFGRPDSEAVPMIAPAGSVCIYSCLATRHAASPFTAPEGHRTNMWVCVSRKDRPWDGGRTFTYKGGADWKGMARFLAEAPPRQRELLGFPPPGDPLWTEEFTLAMAKRYPGFDPAPYLQHQLLEAGRR
jgi:hypothetical protein